MGKIDRYYWLVGDNRAYPSGYQKTASGDMVKYKDHQAAVNKLIGEMEELEKTIKYYQERF